MAQFKTLTLLSLFCVFMLSYTNINATITINSAPPPITLNCVGSGIDYSAFQTWSDAYINSNPATTDCVDGPDLFWRIFEESIILDFNQCGNFSVTFEVSDNCGDFEHIDAPITFSDVDPPVINPNVSTNQTFLCSDLDQIKHVVMGITHHEFTDACSYEMPDVSDDFCSNCDYACPGSFVVNFTATDRCNNEVIVPITFNLVASTDRDNDGIVNDDDNCPDNYNPGQEDIDQDGIGNSCDSNNEVGDLAEIESNLYLSKPYTGIILTSEDSSCYVLIVNNDGGLSTLPVDCP